MSTFVESCAETAIGRAALVARESRHRPRARRLIKLLTGKSNILITTHEQPDPDALASSHALCRLLQATLKNTRITLAVKGSAGGGHNRAFAELSGIKPLSFEKLDLAEFDAILLLDVQPTLAFSPLPADLVPTAVIDHHRTRIHRPKCPFWDVRTDVGATSSIIFSYYMELEIDIDSDLAATLLYAIETDLAGAAGEPGELDNVALSSLTLLADTRKLYRMRYVDLPQSIFIATSRALDNALYHHDALITHIDSIESAEAPAVIANYMLRFDQVHWVLVTARSGNSLVLSLRTSAPKGSAADIMRRLLRDLGEGGGHRTKAGGSIPLQNGTDSEIERLRKTLRRRLLRALGIRMERGLRLIPK